MRTIRTLIVDDERYAREELTYLLEQFPDVKWWAKQKVEKPPF